MTTATAWAISPDHAVTVLAAPGGVPLEVHLSGAALRQPADVLARAVLQTATAAGRKATAELRRELARTVGAEAARTLDRLGLTTSDAGDPGGSGSPGVLSGPDDFGGVLRSAP
jgi:Protein of unknown function (DUF2694)